MRFAPTAKDHIAAAVKMDIREMGKTAQVCFAFRLHCMRSETLLTLILETLVLCPRIDSESNNALIIIDIDECANSEANQCDPNAECTNTNGSYVCRCLSGFQGDGRNCTGK